MNIIISGGWSYGNIGDEVIAKCMLYMIKKTFPNDTITITSYDPEDFTYHHNLSSIKSVHRIINDIGLHDVRDLNNILGKLQFYGLEEYANLFNDETLFIMGGGGYFDSQWKSQYLARLLEIFIAKKHGAKVMLIGQSIGPIISVTERKYAKNAFELCDYIYVRDLKSKELIDQLIGKPIAECGADMAIIISDIQPHKRYSDGKKHVNVMLQNYAFYSKIDRNVKIPSIIEKAFKRIFLLMYIYQYRTKKILLSLVKHENIHIDFVLSVQKTNSNSNNHFLRYCKKVVQDIPKDKYTIHTNINVNDFCSLLSRGNLIISTKMHPLVVSASFNIDTIAISQHYKVDEFMKQIGRSQYCYKSSKICCKKILEQCNKSLCIDHVDSDNIVNMKNEIYRVFNKIKNTIGE